MHDKPHKNTNDHVRVKEDDTQAMRQQIDLTIDRLRSNSAQLITELRELDVATWQGHATRFMLSAFDRQINRSNLKNLSDQTMCYIKTHKLSSSLLAASIASWVFETHRKRSISKAESSDSAAPIAKEHRHQSSCQDNHTSLGLRHGMTALGLGVVFGFSLYSSNRQP